MAFPVPTFYMRLLTPIDYGTIELVDKTVDVIFISAGAQFGYGLFRFSHHSDGLDLRRSAVSTSGRKFNGAD